MQLNYKGNNNKDQSLDPSVQKKGITSTGSTNAPFYSPTMQSGVCNDLTSQQILLAIQDPDLAQQVKGLLKCYCVNELKAFSNPTTILECVHNMPPRPFDIGISLE